MKATELRIGNLVHNMNIANSIERVVLVTGESAHIASGLTPGKRLPYNQIAGIPLTEEWLVKFGFDKLQSKTTIIHDYRYKDYLFNISTKAFWYAPEFYPHGWANLRDVDLKYVHQLQNLYFALTGEELEITETV